MESVMGGMDDPVPSVRWQESEEFMGRLIVIPISSLCANVSDVTFDSNGGRVLGSAQ